MTTFQPDSSFPLEGNSEAEMTSPVPESTPPEAESPTKPDMRHSKPEPSLLASFTSSTTLQVMRAIGYGLILLACIDLLYVLVPPELSNPVWEYQTIGDLAKLAPVPLLAFMLVFFGETEARKRIEQPILKFLSWLTLIIAIVFFLLLPLTLFDSVRISRFNNEQITVQVDQQKMQIDTTKKQIDKASSAELQSLIPAPDDKGKLPNAPKNTEQAKQQALENLQKAKQQTDEKANQARSNLRFNLVKNTAKLVLQVLIAGMIFAYVWVCTRWARDARSWKYSAAASRRSASTPPIAANGSPISSVNQAIKKMQRPVHRSHRRNI